MYDLFSTFGCNWFGGAATMPNRLCVIFQTRLIHSEWQH